MTLSAITKNGKVITPYKMIQSSNAVEAHESYRMIQDLARSGVTLFCLDCYCERGEYRPVSLRKTDPSKTRPHFAHPSNSACQSRPASVESQNHRNGKEFIAQYLEENGATQVMVERRMMSGETCRQPDVMAVYPDRVEAHEIQLSRIDSNGLRARSSDLETLMTQHYPGLTPVVRWYLGTKNQADDNWLVFRPDHWWGYSIRFSEDGLPSWELVSPEIIAELDAAAEAERLRQERFAAERARREAARRQEQLRQAQEREEARARREAWEQKEREAERAKIKAWEQMERTAQNRFMRLKLILSRVIFSGFDFAALFPLLEQCTKDIKAYEAEQWERVQEEARQRVLARIAAKGYRQKDKVKGAPGRVSENWIGTVVEVRVDGSVMVDWDGRRRHDDPRVRKQPVISMLPEQIVPIL